jgi:hypothetical protein
MCFWGESKNVRSGRVFDWDEMQKDGKVIFCGFGEDRIAHFSVSVALSHFEYRNANHISISSPDTS